MKYYKKKFEELTIDKNQIIDDILENRKEWLNWQASYNPNLMYSLPKNLIDDLQKRECDQQTINTIIWSYVEMKMGDLKLKIGGRMSDKEKILDFCNEYLTNINIAYEEAISSGNEDVELELLEQTEYTIENIIEYIENI